jgi:Amt family ammonium transporter
MSGWIDPCDVTGCHWAGGVLGNILTGIFAQKVIAATDGASEIAGGWLDGYFVQIGYQSRAISCIGRHPQGADCDPSTVADSVATTAYAFVVTYVLVALIDCIPGFEVSFGGSWVEALLILLSKVLATDDEIYQGIDAACNGEYLDERQWADEHDRSPFLDDLEKVKTPTSPEAGEDDTEKSYGGGSRVQPVVSSAV